MYYITGADVGPTSGPPAAGPVPIVMGPIRFKINYDLNVQYTI